MHADARFAYIPVRDYLAAELRSPLKHDYVGGTVYERPATRNLHNELAGNALVALHTRSRRKNCRAFNSDTKIRIRLPTHCRFYYPDALIVCRQNSPEDSFQDEPAVIVEVLSRATRRTDEGEKKDAYLTIPSLAVYLLVEQDTAAVVAFRRTENGFVREVYGDMSDIIPLPEIESELPLAEIYEGVEFVPERRPEE